MIEDFIEIKEPVVIEDIKKEKKKRPKKKKRSILMAFSFLLVFFLGSTLTISSVYLLKDELFGENNSNGQCYTKCENKVTINEKGISDAVDKIYDAVVYIENYQKQRAVSSGTGFVYKVDSEKGYILTNYHVISGNESIKVVLNNDKVVDATYLGGDEYMDIAVLSIKKEDVMKVATLGTSANSKLGDTVFTVGTPVDYEYRGTVTRGILSGKDRMVTVNDNSGSMVMKVLQTDSAINPGNSGGPLVNVNGEVIGINSLKLSNDRIEGMGFAIAIEEITGYLNSFEKGEKLTRPQLGINTAEISDIYSIYQAGINIDKSITKGVVIISVVKSSAADGNLKKGDVVTKINGAATDTLAFLRHELFKYQVGDKITVTYIRDGKTKTANITLKAGN